MKKILYSVMAVAAFTFTFSSLTSCEDVPAPYEIPGGDDPDTPVTPSVEPAGTGTQTDPFNVAGALKYIENGGSETTEVYVKGKVVSVVSGSYDASYGSLKYYISDDGTETNQFYVFNGYAGPNRTKFSGEDALKAGDEVVICGKLVTYNGTKEFTTGNYVVSINGNGGGSDQPTPGVATGDGTEANPFNSVAANQYASSLAADVESDKEVYIKGKVVSVKEQYGTQYGNATFYISDDGKADNQFYVYQALYLNNEKYTAGTNINAGDEVVVCGKVVNYKGNTAETVRNKAYLVSLKSNGGGNTGGSDNPGGEVSGNSIKVTPASFGLANGTSVGTQTLSDGTQLIFGAGTNKNDPKFYTSGSNIRMYPTNTLTVKSSKKIKSIILYCDTYNNILCNAEGNVTAQPGTVVVSGEQLNINAINSLETLITNASNITGTASQIRITSIVINYAE